MRESVSLAEFFPLITEVIDAGGEFRLYPRGISMEPMIHQGSDSVLLAKSDSYEVGDILFYKRENGDFVIHRLIEKRGKKFTMCGDHQMALEYGVDPSAVIAKVVGYYKGDVYHSMDEPRYLAYVEKMIKRFPFYRRNPLFYVPLKKLKKLIKKS